ncbi:autotransporter outer membrane beta-barrel domain-containing protein [Pseudomonas moorei]|uniref:autotransporter outer membrane beta-barrel domain-containing protein n=1 Tax=Pseudomonas moorei TaxID=395599 RepID=UPI00200F8EE2|nr:autotransporter outer membrane beta-barrel domain-containing protein [Pseudomonas moorei]
MFALSMHFSRVSVSGALLLLGGATNLANAANCDVFTCLNSPQANVLIDDGSTFNVGTGGKLRDSTVSKGQIDIWDSGLSNSTTIKDEGWLIVHDTGSAVGSILENGQMVVLGSGTAFGTTVNGGFLDVAQNATVDTTRLTGGGMFVYMNAQAKGTGIKSSRMDVYEDAHAELTTVYDGGVLSVHDRASISDTVVNQGGMLDSMEGTAVHNTIVNKGGVMVLGDRAEASDTTINQGGFLQLKGDAILGLASHVDGQVGFAAPAINGFHTLMIKGPLTGNGTFLMNTDLANLKGDLLRVQGPVSDMHTLVVGDTGNVPGGALQKLMLVDGNGGSGNFKLYGETVDAGAYRYRLQQQGNDWFLANSEDESRPVDQPNEGQEPPPEQTVPPVVPAKPQEPSVPPLVPARPEVPARRPQAETLSKGANAAVASHAASAALISAQMSATAGHFGELRSGKDKGGVWTRGYGTDQRMNTGTSRPFQQQINGMEIGADKALPVLDGTLYVGGLIGQGQGRQAFAETSKGTIDSTTLGVYTSYLDRSGLYVDSALKYSRLDNEINITSNLGNKVKARYKNHALSADVQVGKHIDLGQGWFIEPQAGLQIAHISEGRYTASNGLTVKQDAMNSLQSRVGGLFGRDLALANGLSVKPYAKATWITEHAGASLVTVSGAKLDSRLPGSRGEIGGGVMVTTAKRHNLFVEGGYTKGHDIEQPWALTAGYRYNW